jgi:hypothetical protein
LNFTSPGLVALQASKQAKQPHGRTKKRKRNKETIQNQNTKLITISLNLRKQKLASS